MHELECLIAAIEGAEGVGLGSADNINAASFFGAFGDVGDVAEGKDEFGLEPEDVCIEAKVIISAEQSSVDIHLAF